MIFLIFVFYYFRIPCYWSVTLKSNLVINFDYVVDPNNPSNGFIKDLELTSSYFPGAAAVKKARSKFAIATYRGVMAQSKEFVPFVLETQGRWGFHAREFFKLVHAKIPIKGSRVSRNFWQLKNSLAYMRLAYIIHRFHTVRKNLFGPAAHQDLYFFDSFHGQN